MIDPGGGASTPSFNDNFHPTSELKPTTAEHPEDFTVIFQESLDAIDPGSWVLEAINEIVGYDPIETVMERLGGDWQAYSKAGNMLEHLGDFFIKPELI